MHILLIEDDIAAAHYLMKGLRESGHNVDHAGDGDSGLGMALNGNYELLIVDRMLPQRDGLAIIRMLRADARKVPVLILSALGDVDERVRGLRAGGDDYLVKPCAFSELLARIEALARRADHADSTQKLRIADLELDVHTQRVTRGGRSIRLQPREYRLLAYLLRHTGQVVTRTMLLEQVWDFHFDPQTNVIDTQISRLRAKIGNDSEKPLLHTVRGIGYRLDESA